MRATSKFLLLFELAAACTLLIDGFFVNIVGINLISVGLGLLFLALVFLLRFEADNRRYNSDSIYTILIFTITYYILIYLLGLLVGFYKNQNNLSPLNILKNIFQMGLFIVASEMFRYMVAVKGKKSRTVLILLVLILSLCDTSDLIYKCNFIDISDTIDLCAYHVLPSILKNVALTYIAIKVGYKPTIVYRLILELPQYFLPIIPNTGMYLQAIINIILPIILFLWFYKIFKKATPFVFRDKYKGLKIFLLIMFTIPIIAGIVLVSGIFKYYSVAVGSGSMSPTIEKGDSVIVKKLQTDELKHLQPGEILVYKHSGRVIVHRIKDIVLVKDEYYFYTKGDYNNAADSYSTKQSDVIGIAVFKIPWIGTPAVWIQELANF